VVRLAAVPALLAFGALAAAGLASCSFATGQGSITGTLNVASCWSGPFNLNPDFFAASPYMTTLELRIQRGGDYETFSDGVVIQIDDTTTIRGDATHPSEYGQPLTVSLPPDVTPPGVPVVPVANPSIVHMSLYLQATCQIQDVALYALDSVTLNAAGGCDPRDGGEPVIVCQGGTSGLAPPAWTDGGGSAGAPDAGGEGGTADAGGAPDAGSASPILGHSTITFTSLFDGDPSEVSAQARLNQGTFQVYLADPREVCPGGLGPPPPCRGYLEGNFKFYFERGRPAQPFP
jgi:hypothetical protein